MFPFPLKTLVGVKDVYPSPPRSETHVRARTLAMASMFRCRARCCDVQTSFVQLVCVNPKSAVFQAVATGSKCSTTGNGS